LVDVYGDRMAGVVRMARPESALWLLAGGTGTLAALLSVLVYVEESRHPERALVIWIFLGLCWAPLVGLVSGTLVARAERAHLGLRHPRRFLWVAAGLGAVGVVHWVALAAWIPALAVKGALGSSRAMNDAIEGALTVSPSLVGIGVFGATLVWALKRLRGRSWDGVTAERKSRMPRLPTAAVASLLYGLCAAIPALAVSVIALQEGELGFGVGAWMVSGAVVGGGSTVFAVWLYRRLPHALGRSVDSLRFAEIFGALWAVHWGLPFLLVLLPAWSAGPDRFFFAVVTAGFWVTGIGGWSLGRVYREAL